MGSYTLHCPAPLMLLPDHENGLRRRVRNVVYRNVIDYV